MSVELDLVVSYLGGKRAIGIKGPEVALTLHRAVEAGIPAQCAFFFKQHAGFSNLLICQLLGVSEKTFTRWQANPKKPLDPVSSDRLVRTAKIMALAEQVLESADNARQWMSEPQSALGNEIPQELLTTNVGAQQVEDLLLQMEHGYLA